MWRADARHAGVTGTGFETPAAGTDFKHTWALPPRMLEDGFGREVTGVRVSLTDRCNFDCVYCHNEGLGDTRGPMAPAGVSKPVPVTPAWRASALHNP